MKKYVLQFVMDFQSEDIETEVEPPCYWNLMWKHLNHLRATSQFCDLILISSDDVAFSVHSVVMSAVSKVRK